LSILLFITDHIIYRIGARDLYETQLQKLAQLVNASKLSEYDSRLNIKDKKECYGDISIPNPKANEIESTLKKYGLHNGRGLNIGCGGELHQRVSKPFFDQGFDMLGLDISEEYLREYNSIFKTDVMLANSMALPIRNDAFDLINYTDILEHLHHPFLGLCEANRVLKHGGRIILATPYRCRFSPRCLNPLIFIETVISLYNDKILGPRLMLSGFQDMAYYHLEFSKGEVEDMLESAGFEVFSFDTYFAKSKTFTKLFRKLPILRFMGGSIMVIGVKNHGYGIQTH
jgi:SAM-dependent methyltransferase